MLPHHLHSRVSSPVHATGPLGVWKLAGDEEDGIEGDEDFEAGLATKTRPRTKRPNMFKVLLLNDDYTPMEFVVTILQEVFNKNSDDAWHITMQVHQHGVGQCGIFPFEVAETKVMRVMDAAQKNQHPLQCVLEKQ